MCSNYSKCTLETVLSAVWAFATWNTYYHTAPFVSINLPGGTDCLFWPLILWVNLLSLVLQVVLGLGTRAKFLLTSLIFPHCRFKYYNIAVFRFGFGSHRTKTLLTIPVTVHSATEPICYWNCIITSSLVMLQELQNVFTEFESSMNIRSLLTIAQAYLSFAWHGDLDLLTSSFNFLRVSFVEWGSHETDSQTLCITQSGRRTL